MQTTLEILKKTTDYFSTRGIANPKFDAQKLIAHALGIEPMQVYLEFDRPLAESELEKIRPLVRRRGQREPLQHILGSCGFRNLDLKCDTRALIPRPDTECLVDHCQKYCQHSEAKVLEIGTGTGAIILALLEENPHWTGVGVDISTDALELFRENSEKTELSERLEIIESDLFSQIPSGSQFDLIVTNPPYIPRQNIEKLDSEVKKFDPILALDGGVDGLDLVRQILANSAKYLKEGGVLLMEIGFDQCDLMKELSAPELRFLTSERDLAGISRFPIWKKN